MGFERFHPLSVVWRKGGDPQCKTHGDAVPLPFGTTYCQKIVRVARANLERGPRSQSKRWHVASTTSQVSRQSLSQGEHRLKGLNDVGLQDVAILSGYVAASLRPLGTATLVVSVAPATKTRREHRCGFQVLRLFPVRKTGYCIAATIRSSHPDLSALHGIAKLETTETLRASLQSKGAGRPQ